MLDEGFITVIVAGSATLLVNEFFTHLFTIKAIKKCQKVLVDGFLNSIVPVTLLSK